MNALIQLFTAMAFKKNKQFVEQNKLDHTKAYNVTKDLQPVLSIVNDVICGTCSDEVDAALAPHQHTPHAEAVAPVAPVVVIEEEVVAPPTVVEVVEVVAEEEAAAVVVTEEVVETTELPVVEDKPVVEEAVAPEEEKSVVASKTSGKKKKSAKAK